MQRKYDFVFKFVIVGSSSVGKSSILKRFADDDFEDSYISTIGIDFRFKSLMIDEAYVKLQIWDTAGQERFRGITKSYYKGAHSVILVYDINNPKSFEDITKFWLKEARDNLEDNQNNFIFINKCDHHDVEIPAEQIEWMTRENIEFFKVSAKTGMNVADAILLIARKMMEIYPREAEEKVSLGLKQSTGSGYNQKSRCCLKN